MRILIVCEGAETEPRYFREFIQHHGLTAVRVAPGKGGTPKAVVQKAEESRAEGYDEIWCVFDAEAADSETVFRQAIQQAKNNAMPLAISVPCFEVWYLFHFVYTTRPFTNAEAVKRTLQTHISDYRERMDVFGIVHPHTQAAITNAERALREHGDDVEHPNCSSTVCHLVGKLLSLAEEQRQ